MTALPRSKSDRLSAVGGARDQFGRGKVLLLLCCSNPLSAFEKTFWAFVALPSFMTKHAGLAGAVRADARAGRSLFAVTLIISMSYTNPQID